MRGTYVLVSVTKWTLVKFSPLYGVVTFTVPFILENSWKSTRASATERLEGWNTSHLEITYSQSTYMLITYTRFHFVITQAVYKYIKYRPVRKLQSAKKREKSRIIEFN